INRPIANAAPILVTLKHSQTTDRLALPIQTSRTPRMVRRWHALGILAPPPRAVPRVVRVPLKALRAGTLTARRLDAVLGPLIRPEQRDREPLGAQPALPLPIDHGALDSAQGANLSPPLHLRYMRATVAARVDLPRTAV